MRIHKVRIDNFRRLKDYTVDFCYADGTPRPLTILVGPNMSGKTTVLDALHLAYSCINNAQQPDLRPGLDAADPGLRPDPNRPLEVDIEFSLQPGEWEAIDEIEKLLGSTGLSVQQADRYQLEFRWPPPTQSYLGVTRTHPFRANLAFRGRATAKVARTRRLIEEGYFERIGGLLYLDQHRSLQLPRYSTATGRPEEIRERAGSEDVMPWLELVARLDQKWDPKTQGESAWSRVKRLYAQLAAPAEIDDMKAADEGFYLRLAREGQTYEAEGMSSGERQILRLVVNLTAFRALRSVVLVDELELHLHPAWQRTLLHFCRRGGGDSNQFIITTHSDSLLRYTSPDDVVRLGDLGER
ncbi:MAG TPA: AAA family ATPase [Candidatus Nanopelagicales bacterium]|nr:AAA family ATPase [Candidatus Nanopelagicales bacterium]